MNTKY